jgi:rsbT co-antagonist protein RsbR
MTTTSESRQSDPFFRDASTPLAVLASGGIIARANDAFTRVMSPSDDVTGRAFDSLVREADRQRVMAALGTPGVGELAVFEATPLASSMNGVARSLRFHATRTDDDEVLVTGIVAPPGALSAERIALLWRVLETVPLVVWAVDANGAYTISEGRGLDLLRLEPGECVGLNALEVHGDQPEIAGALARALAGERSRMTTTPAPGLHFDSWFLPLCSATGEVEGAIGIEIDATDRIKSERAATESAERVERQSATIRALATPIIKVWDEVLCMPVIGTVDSARTSEMMQGLLEAIVREQARYAIIDLTGVEVVDTSTADHLIQLFRAARVLGVEGILCGIRPAVAQTVVALGLELSSVKTMRSLRDALRWCIRARASGTQNGAAKHAHTEEGRQS